MRMQYVLGYRRLGEVGNEAENTAMSSVEEGVNGGVWWCVIGWLTF